MGRRKITGLGYRFNDSAFIDALKFCSCRSNATRKATPTEKRDD